MCMISPSSCPFICVYAPSVCSCIHVYASSTYSLIQGYAPSVCYACVHICLCSLSLCIHVLCSINFLIHVWRFISLLIYTCSCFIFYPCIYNHPTWCLSLYGWLCCQLSFFQYIGWYAYHVGSLSTCIVMFPRWFWSL